MSRIDRVAEPWGSRTAHGPGERRPTRARWANGTLEELSPQVLAS
jgi:hypothetical protein